MSPIELFWTAKNNWYGATNIHTGGIHYDQGPTVNKEAFKGI